MRNATSTTAGFFAHWTEPAVLAQLISIILISAIALFASHAAHRWHERSMRRSSATAWRAAVLEGGVVLVGFLSALILILAVRTAFAGRGLPTSTLDIALQLILAGTLVRLAVYLLRLVLGNRIWLRNWELRLTLIFWAIVSFELVGWFGAIESGLDGIDLLPGARGFSLWALLKGLVVIGGFALITSVIARAIERHVMGLENVAVSTRIGITKFAYFFLVSLGILLGINAAGVDLTAFTVLTGALGLGLGIGLQSITANFVSGFVLLMDKSIKPGDVISFTGQSGTSTENFGWVQELRGRYVVVRDRDGVETLVPNQQIITNAVINWSYSDRRIRLKLPVRISFRDDPERALPLLLQACEGHPRVLHEPPAASRLMEFTDSGMNLELRFWIADPENGVNNVRSDVNRAIWRLFREAGITIPVAQREIVVRGGERLPAD
jgi:small-conductance mechanosensitive channel